MARPVAIRASYAADAGTLARLMEAVDKDARLSPARKTSLGNALRAASHELLTADGEIRNVPQLVGKKTA